MGSALLTAAGRTLPLFTRMYPQALVEMRSKRPFWPICRAFPCYCSAVLDLPCSCTSRIVCTSRSQGIAPFLQVPGEAC